MMPPEQRAKEIQAIDERRRLQGRAKVKWRTSDKLAGDAEPPDGDKVIYNLTGLALSGGGIRSAATCLGAVQALQATNRLSSIDYLSTVSGGGYLGCCLSANLSETGIFPFSNKSNDGNDLQDSAGVKYLRDHTNYLMPAGFADFLASLGVILRGLTTSACVVLGPILLAAGLTGWLWGVTDWLKLKFSVFISFPFTLAFAFLFVLYLFCLAIHRSILEVEGKSSYEFRGAGSKVTVAGIWIVIGAFIVELQPLAIEVIREPALLGDFSGKALELATSAYKFLTPFVALVTLFANSLADAAKPNSDQSSKSSVVKSISSRVALWIVAIILPLLLWQLYLVLASSGIKDGGSYRYAFDLIAPLGDRIPKVYVAVGFALLVLCWFLEPNANSLHRLYRDRLGDTFLFLAPTDNEENVNSVDRMKLSGLNTEQTPYLLINTALNIQGSEYANKRSRDADFFLFSKDYIGSRATGYVPTETMEKVERTLDLATAMAVSGAAASSNMGASALKPLSFTLALLNVRLGFWLINPGKFPNAIGRAGNSAETFDLFQVLYIWPRLFSVADQQRDAGRQLYLWAEMLSKLDETADSVYLTDGGHIENLGVYELLRRRCQLIIVVDAEADPTLSFSSFMAVQRFARIDLGIRIDLPWQEVRERFIACQAELARTVGSGEVFAGTNGCHVAVGTIVYPDAPTGKLIYLKSTLTGDENDIVLNYKRKYPAFPHENTADQFFGEEQFEAYRALGFHGMKKFLDGDDKAAGLMRTKRQSKVQRVRAIDELFGYESLY